MSVFRLFLGDTGDGKEEAWLSTVIVFKEHVGVTVRTNMSLKSMVNILVILRFLRFNILILVNLLFKISSLYKFSQLCLC